MTSEATTWQQRVTIVLVKPEESLNVGSIARVMANFGAKKLTLVHPFSLDRHRAGITARFGESILDRARSVSSLSEALEDHHTVVGFSSRKGKYRRGHCGITEWLELLETNPLHSLALLFGPESSGLSLEDTAHCAQVVFLPTEPDTPSMNISHAVACVLFALTLSLTTAPEQPREPPALGKQYESLDTLVRALAVKSEFFRPGHPPEIEGVLQNIFRRASLTTWEMEVVLGFFGRCLKRLRAP